MTDWQTDRQTDRNTDWLTDRQTERQTERQASRQKKKDIWQTANQTDRKQTDTNRQKDRQIILFKTVNFLNPAYLQPHFTNPLRSNYTWHFIVYVSLQPNCIFKVRRPGSQNDRWNLHVNYIVLPTSVLVGLPLWTDSWYSGSKAGGQSHVTIRSIAKITNINTNKLTK